MCGKIPDFLHKLILHGSEQFRENRSSHTNYSMASGRLTTIVTHEVEISLSVSSRYALANR